MTMLRTPKVTNVNSRMLMKTGQRRTSMQCITFMIPMSRKLYHSMLLHKETHSKSVAEVCFCL
jgi:hypothetical protein